nr:helix-turn-helix domain-containing protein [Alkalicella caledoniensis]
MGEKQNVTVVYNAESNDVLHTVSEVAKLLKTNPSYVYDLIRAGLLPGLKLGSMKVARSSLMEFLEKYQNHDLTDPFNIKPLEQINA